VVLDLQEQRLVVVPVVAHPEVPQDAAHGVDVLQVGDVAQQDRPVDEQRGREDRQRRVLAAGDRNGAVEVLAAADSNAIHRSSLLATEWVREQRVSGGHRAGSA
jgi:hypothetical protein